MLTYPAITKRKLRAREHRERAIHDSWEGQGGFMQRWDLRRAGFQQGCVGGEVTALEGQREHRPAPASWADICEPATASLTVPTPGPSHLGGLTCMAQARGQDGVWLCVLGRAELWKASSMWLLLTSKGSENILTSSKVSFFVRVAIPRHTALAGLGRGVAAHAGTPLHVPTTPLKILPCSCWSSGGTSKLSP